jgi:hypothetical protein
MPRTAKAQPAPEQPSEPTREMLEEILALLAPFTGNLVDVDVFSDADFLFTVTDVRRKKRRFPVPGDPPFPVVLGFLDAHDELAEAREQLEATRVAAVGNTREATAARERFEDAKARERKAVTDLADAFARVLAMRTRGVTGAKLLEEFGANLLEAWYLAAIARFNRGRLQAAMAALGSPGKAPDPPAAKGRRSRSRSGA